MVDSLVRGVLGPGLSGLLDFYITYSLWINAPLVAGALAYTVARSRRRNAATADTGGGTNITGDGAT